MRSAISAALTSAERSCRGLDRKPALPTPIPAALPLFATGLGALGLIGWRRKRKQNSLIKTPDWISQRPPRGGLSVYADPVLECPSKLHLLPKATCDLCSLRTASDHGRREYPAQGIQGPWCRCTGQPSLPVTVPACADQ